ncbi:High mobility group protein DSP1, partial [Pseudolycoriella hygida]
MNHQQIHQNNQQSPPAKMGRRQRKQNDGKPKKCINAYAFFLQTCHDEHKKKYPEERMFFTEFSRMCSERWKSAAINRVWHHCRVSAIDDDTQHVWNTTSRENQSGR